MSEFNCLKKTNNKKEIHMTQLYQIMVEATFWASIWGYIELQAGSLMSGHNLKWARGMFLMVCNSSDGFAFQVKLLEGPSEVIIPQLKKKYEVDTLDFVFVDHWKDRYAPDTILLQVSLHNSSLKSTKCLWGLYSKWRTLSSVKRRKTVKTANIWKKRFGGQDPKLLSGTCISLLHFYFSNFLSTPFSAWNCGASRTFWWNTILLAQLRYHLSGSLFYTLLFDFTPTLRKTVDCSRKATVREVLPNFICSPKWGKILFVSFQHPIAISVTKQVVTAVGIES